MTLKKMLQFFEAKEAGKQSASRLLDFHSAEAASAYRRYKATAQKTNQQKNNPHRPDKSEICTYCGKKGHGKCAFAKLRKKECLANGHVCTHCGRENHLETMCRNKDKQKGRKGVHRTDDNSEGAIFTSLCVIAATGKYKGKRTLPLDHHLYNQLSDTWMKQASKPQPFIWLTVDALHEDYDRLGFCATLYSNAKPADTGCQSCLFRLPELSQGHPPAGYQEGGLDPRHDENACSKNAGITILGAPSYDSPAKMWWATLWRPDRSSPPTAATLEDDQAPMSGGSGLAVNCDCPRRQLPPPLQSSHLSLRRRRTTVTRCNSTWSTTTSRAHLTRASINPSRWWRAPFWNSW